MQLVKGTAGAVVQWMDLDGQTRASVQQQLGDSMGQAGLLITVNSLPGYDCAHDVRVVCEACCAHYWQLITCLHARLQGASAWR